MANEFKTITLTGRLCYLFMCIEKYLVLLEFDNYRDTNEWEFDGELLEEDYLELVSLYKGITDGSGDAEIDKVLMLPIDFNNECECTNFEDADEPTLTIIERAQAILEKHNIELPDIEEIINIKMDYRGGWGDFVESEHLSIILNAVR